MNVCKQIDIMSSSAHEECEKGGNPFVIFQPLSCIDCVRKLFCIQFATIMIYIYTVIYN